MASDVLKEFLQASFREDALLVQSILVYLNPKDFVVTSFRKK